jgi:uncharacterized protein (DUF433 family)
MNIKVLPGVASGWPLLGEGSHPRIQDIVDRVRAGDSIADVAGDFGVHTDSVQLLWEIVKALAKGQGETLAEEHKHPDCRHCNERLRINVGLMRENRQLKQDVEGERDIARRERKRVHRTENAARKLWEAATEMWPTNEMGWMDQSSSAYPSASIRGKELYEIGVELGFIEEVER